MINFITFLDQAKSSDWSIRPVTCFYGVGQFPALFFSRLFLFLKTNSYKNFEFSTLKSQEKSVRAATLQQTFLGEQKRYWLGDVAGQDALKFQDLSSLLGYQGPHKIMFFVTSEELLKNVYKNVTTIELDLVIRYGAFEKLVSFFNVILNPVQTRFAEQLFLRVPNLSLDSALLFLEYLELMPEPKRHGFGITMLNLLEPETHFFELSNFFFKKDSKNFFTKLKKISDDYTEPFWISYWSDQLWRAHNTINFLEQKNIAQAKRSSYRLPYAFITQQWKTQSLAELRHAHDFLYQADCGFKTGQNFCSLDFFYMQFFNGAFAKESNV